MATKRIPPNMHTFLKNWPLLCPLENRPCKARWVTLPVLRKARSQILTSLLTQHASCLCVGANISHQPTEVHTCMKPNPKDSGPHTQTGTYGGRGEECHTSRFHQKYRISHGMLEIYFGYKFTLCMKTVQNNLAERVLQ